MRAILVEEYGGPDNLKVVEIPKPTPGPGDVIVKIAASGVNFIDVYFRTGLYKMPTCRSRSAAKPRAWSKQSDPT